MNFNDGIRALDGFFLGAAMQTSPMLDDYGGMDEPDDYDDSPPPTSSKAAHLPKQTGESSASATDEDLFAGLEEPQAQVKKPNPTSYNNLLAVFCGSHALATYWYDKIHHLRK